MTEVPGRKARGPNDATGRRLRKAIAQAGDSLQPGDDEPRVESIGVRVSVSELEDLKLVQIARGLPYVSYVFWLFSIKEARLEAARIRRELEEQAKPEEQATPQ